MFYSIAKPIFINNELVGVYGGDFPIDPLYEDLFRFSSDEIYGFITDKFGGIVYHPKLPTKQHRQILYDYFPIAMIEFGEDLYDKVLYHFYEDKTAYDDVKVTTKWISGKGDYVWSVNAEERNLTYHFRNVSQPRFKLKLNVMEMA